MALQFEVSDHFLSAFHRPPGQASMARAGQWTAAMLGNEPSVSHGGIGLTIAQVPIVGKPAGGSPLPAIFSLPKAGGIA